MILSIPTQTLTAHRAKYLGQQVPGLLLCTVLGLASIPLGDELPLIGAPIFAVLLGILLGNTVTLPSTTELGVQWSIHQLLKWSIVGLGLKLSIDQLWEVGTGSLRITLVTLSLAFVTGLVMAYWLKVPKALAILIAAGTAICGAAAIAAVATVLRPKQQHLTVSLAIIFLFNLAAVLVFPILGHGLQLTDTQFGVWAGTAINDTSSVLAAAYSYSDTAGDTAMIVKLTRASFILPVCLILMLVQPFITAKTTEKTSLFNVLPWFILAFVGASMLHSWGNIPAALEQHALHVANFMLLMALAAVGLNSRLALLKQTGIKPLLLGFTVSLVVAGSSLALQYIPT